MKFQCVCIRIILLDYAKKNDSVLPEYVLLYLNSSEGKAIMKEKAKTTAGLYNSSAGKINTISVPYLPLNYQLSIF